MAKTLVSKTRYRGSNPRTPAKIGEIEESLCHLDCFGGKDVIL